MWQIPRLHIIHIRLLEGRFIIHTFLGLPVVVNEKKIFFMSQGTVSVIHVTIHAKIAVPDSQRHPLKRCLIKYDLDINVYNLRKLIFSIVYSLQ